MLHGTELARFSEALADAVGTVLDVGDMPFILGGDCSILLGIARGRRSIR